MNALLLAGVVIFAGLAIFLKDMLKAVICLLISSVFLGIIFFRLNAPFAGVFEISVVAGLIMVLFILTISLVGSQDTVSEPDVPFFVFVILFLIFSYIVNIAIPQAGINERPMIVDRYCRFNDTLWIGRTFDMIGQISVILAGVFVLLLIIGRRKK